jgi:hypothetical protein
MARFHTMAATLNVALYPVLVFTLTYIIYCILNAAQLQNLTFTPCGFYESIFPPTICIACIYNMKIFIQL